MGETKGSSQGANPGMMNIGKGRTVKQLAEDLALPYSTVYNNPCSFGGVKIGGRWFFFEALVEKALWSQFKETTNASMEKRQEGKKDTLWSSQNRRETEGKEMQDLGRGAKMGAAGKRPCAGAVEIDPHGLLDPS